MTYFKGTFYAIVSYNFVGETETLSSAGIHRFSFYTK